MAAHRLFPHEDGQGFRSSRKHLLKPERLFVPLNLIDSVANSASTENGAAQYPMMFETRLIGGRRIDDSQTHAIWSNEIHLSNLRLAKKL